MCSLPHARGGVSGTAWLAIEGRISSPRPWGCFSDSSVSLGEQLALPHARGGVSAMLENGAYLLISSPRPWGCFYLLAIGRYQTRLFPTPVGVFLLERLADGRVGPLPHARGGVSIAELKAGANYTSSPRPWGCFRI